MAKDLDGKVFLVTGATEGIGKFAALDFAKRGAEVVVVGRKKEKTERVVAELKAGSGNDKVTAIIADLSKLADMKACAEAFRATHDRLDVLVNNAGGVFTKRSLTADGMEMTFALNHLGYFFLTNLLLDLLKKTPGSRVISTSSGAHEMGKIDFDDLKQREKSYSGFGAYGDSKLANILFTRELARRVGGSGVIANCVHPGWVSTGFGLNNGGVFSKLLGVVSPILARTPEKGAETVIWAATSPDAAKFNGEYFKDRKVGRSTAKSKDVALAGKLWDFSAKICGVV